jgi:hypothetical protein
MIPSRPAAAALAAALLALGCFGERREPKAPGAAIWIGARSQAPERAVLDRLASLGVGEHFVESARLSWQAGRPVLESAAAPRVARQERTTLVVAGPWPSAAPDADAAARALAEGIQGLRVEAERAGRLPVGVHFDLADGVAGAGFAATLRELRKALDEQLYLSASVGPADLGRESTAEALRPLDFVVAFLYGQRPGEAEDAAAWDLQAVEGRVRTLEALGKPYFLVASTIGGASWRGRDGSPKASSSELDLGALVRDVRLELKRGFSLEGVDRQVYEFRARSPLEVGGWKLGASESVRVVRAATSNVEEFLRRVGAWDSEHRLGPLFWRLPAANERLSMTAANLADALAPDPSRPQLDLLVERSAADRQTWTVRLSLVNGNDEGTDLGFFDSNYVDLSVEGASVFEVDPGGFARFEQSYQGRKDVMAALRSADRVRFFAPVVEGRERLTSGPIVLRLAEQRKDAVVRTGGRFLLTAGEYLDLEEREWTFGSGE